MNEMKGSFAWMIVSIDEWVMLLNKPVGKKIMGCSDMVTQLYSQFYFLAQVELNAF